MPEPDSLDKILQATRATIVPGVFDALSARIAVRARAKLLYMTGFGVAGAGFGRPDIGLVSASQMIERVGVIAEAAAPLPLIADGDNGHGGPLNAAQITRDKEVISREEAARKIRAASDARSDKSFKIMARTDARATHGLDEALRRCESFLKAGADILFVEAPRSEEELRRVAVVFQGVPLVANLVEDGNTPMLTVSEISDLGYRIILYPISALLAVTRRLEETYELLLTGQRRDVDSGRSSFDHYNEIMNLPEMLAVTEALSQSNDEE